MAELTIAPRFVEDVLVLRLDGKITMGDGALILRNAIKEQIPKGTKRLVLELRGISYVDSSGIHALVETFTTTNRHGIKVAYADFSQKLTDLLTITKLLTVFEVFDTVQEAVRHLKKT
jgi:anti-sigma B factor antagonist